MIQRLLRIALLAALCLALSTGALAEYDPPSATRIEVLDSAFDGRNALVEFRLTPVRPDKDVLFNPAYQEQDDELYVYEQRELIPFPMLYRRDDKTILYYMEHITGEEPCPSFRIRGVDEEDDGSLVLRAYGRVEEPQKKLQLNVAARVMIFDVLYETDTVELTLKAESSAADRILEALLSED